MTDLSTQPQLGPYRLVRRLADGPLGPRQLALHERAASNHAITFVDRLRLPQDRDRAERALADLRELQHAHLLAIDDFGFEDEHGRARAWVASPYTGDVDGLVTLATLLKRRGGYLPPMEARTAIVQVLGAMAYAHGRGVRNGVVTLEQVQVDRRGSLALEHYGLAARALWTAPASDDFEQQELISVLELAYRLVTGLAAEEPLIPPGRMVPDLDPTWEDWFETGLMQPRQGKPGFRSAAHALSALEAGTAGGAKAEGTLAIFRRVSRLMTPRM